MTKTQSVLIIEDDEWLAENYARVIKRDGYKPAVALNAVEAIQAIDEVRPDVIILDVLLTGSTAFVLLHELQSYGDTGKIPIIICSNLASELDIDDLIPYGVKRILDKTVMKPDDLLAAIRGVLL